MRRLGALLAAALLPAAVMADADYSKGDTVTISGRVTDPDGAPVGNVTVLLELSRNRFQLRSFRRVESKTLRIPVIADDDGRYRHDWRWDSHYNTFVLAVAMPVPRDGRDDFEVLRRFEITQPVKQGSPVEVPLVIQDTTYLDWLRRFGDGRASSEEIRVFKELDAPDRLDHGTGNAWAWWYFEAGKVYRFRDGEIEELETFEPIESP